MRVKIFDESHEKDLENKLNEFISLEKYDIIDIKYQVALAVYGDEQLFCFSALVQYEEK